MKRAIGFVALLFVVVTVLVSACGGEIADGIRKGDVGTSSKLTGWNLVIYDESYERSAMSIEELEAWRFDESKGYFCETSPLVEMKAIRADGKRLFVEPLEAECKDFDGWIPVNTFEPS